MPRPPQIDAAMIMGLGLDQSFADIKNVDDLVGRFTKPRDNLSHFLLRDQPQPLHISDGPTYRFYSCGAALLLLYAHASVRDLMIYFNQHLHGHLARGTKLILPEDKELLVLKFDAYSGRFGESEDEEENDMSRPMFMTVVQGRKIEFINISHVVRVEVVHPVEGEAGSGIVHLQDGTSRQLGEAEINFVMRTFQGLVGEPVAGTQDAPPGYWKGNKPEGEAKAD